MNYSAIFFLATTLSVLATEPGLKVSMLEGNIECLHVSHVAVTLADEISAAQNALAATNQTAGIVLDLRFADGDDLTAGQAVARMLATEKLPLAILVNGATRGEAVTLAAQLRAARAGLIFGGVTAAAKSTGSPLQPDIAVKSDLEAERTFQNNPYAMPGLNETNLLAATNSLLAFVDHTSESELVSKRIKDGDADADAATPRAEPPRAVIRDPALARAVDLLTARAVLRHSRG
jgi:hypothetical protein